MVSRLGKIKEHDDRRITNRNVVAGKIEAPGFAIDTEDGDVVASLIAAIQELASRVEVEAARIISSRPFFTGIFQRAVLVDGKDPDAVVQSIAGVHILAIRGHQDLGAEVAPGEPRRQGRDRLT